MRPGPIKYLLAIFLIVLMPGVKAYSQEAENLNTDGLVDLRIGQGINGAVLGVSFAFFAEETMDLGIIGIPLVPATIAGGIVWPGRYTENESMTHNEAALINMSSLWGIFTGVSIGVTSDNDDFTVPLFIMLLDGGATIGALKYTSERKRETTSGEVFIMGSSILWGSVSAIAVTEIAGLNSEHEAGLTLSIGLALGAAGGALLQNYQSWDRERVQLINLSILGGLMAGFGTTALITKKWPARWLGGFMGMIAGTTLGIYFTRHLEDEDQAPLQNKSVTEKRVLLPVMKFSF